MQTQLEDNLSTSRASVEYIPSGQGIGVTVLMGQ